MPTAFDTTILSALLNPNCSVPTDPATGRPVEHPKERIEGLLTKLPKAKDEIIIPAPVTAEILTVIGPTNTDYFSIINRSRVFKVVSLDDKAVVELAFLNRDLFAARDKKSKAQPYQKVRVDRQILAICKVAGCNALYTDDNSLIACAKLLWDGDRAPERSADLRIRSPA